MADEQLPFQDIIGHSRDAIIIAKTPLDGSLKLEIVYGNAAFQTLTGFASADIMGQHPRVIFSPEASEEADHAINLALQRRDSVQVLLLNRSRDEHQSWLDMYILPVINKEGMITHLVLIGRDVTEQKVLESHLEAVTRTDPLTGMLNRRAFYEQLNREWGRSRRYNTVYAIILADIDGLKSINDTYGHIVGDMVIRVIASHCQAQFRSQDVISRLGGDEIVILMPETEIDGAYLAAGRLHEMLTSISISTTDWEIKIAISLGVAQVNATDNSPEDVMQHAEDALNDAKQKGKNRVSRGEY